MIVSKRGAIWNIRIEKNLSDKFATCVTASALNPVPLLSYSKKRKEFPKILSTFTYHLTSVSQTAKGIATSNKQLMLFSSQISGTYTPDVINMYNILIPVNIRKRNLQNRVVHEKALERFCTHYLIALNINISVWEYRDDKKS